MPSGKIVWLASYPKSGNTWLRIVLGALANVAGRDAFANARMVLRFTTPEWFDGIFTPKSIEDSHHIAAHWLDAQRQFHAAADSGLKIVKTHNMAARISGHWFTTPEYCHSVVHVVRDPRDVAFSSAHFFDLSIEAACAQLLSDDRSLCDDGFFCEYIGSWATHTRSWEWMETKRGVRRLVLRYEDMLSDPAQETRRVAQFFGLAVDDAAIARATEVASFDALRAREAREGFEEAHGDRPFFRKGEAGEGRRLPPNLRAQLNQRFGDVMRDYGYAPH